MPGAGLENSFFTREVSGLQLLRHMRSKDVEEAAFWLSL